MNMIKANKKDIRVKLIYLLFFISGITGLIYESIWSRYLKLLLGHSSFGHILTISIFMGGLGFGSILAGKYISKIKKPLLFYVLIEVLIGIGGLFYHDSFVFFQNFYYKIASSSLITSSIIKILISIVITFPLATLIGFTFPIISAGVIRLTKDNGKKSIAFIYFVNSIGAALGAIITSFYLIKQFGLQNTLTIAALINFMIALSMFILNKSIIYDPKTILPSSNIIDKQQDIDSGFSFKHIVFWISIIFFTGFSSFLYEIGWLRLTGLIFGSSTHSFDILIACFIFGLAIGALYAIKLLQTSDLKILAAKVQLLMGCSALLSILLIIPTIRLINFCHNIFAKTEIAYYIFTVCKFIFILALTFPTCFFAGMTMPVITYMIFKNTR